jgi:hypothetical protein
VILLTAVLAGALFGSICAWRANEAWRYPEFKYPLLVAIAFLPQILAFYLPLTRGLFSDCLASGCLIGSQVMLMGFCLVNIRLPGMPILAGGLLLNLAAIIANDGFMPISLDTAAQLIPGTLLDNLTLGKRLGVGSKDILLPAEQVVLPWLADRFLLPKWFPYQFAFSLGDILIAAGAFVLMAKQNNPEGQSRKADENAYKSIN